MSLTDQKLRATLGKNLRKRRNELKLTLKDLSERVGLSISFLGQIERGTSNMTVVDFDRILNALELVATIHPEATKVEVNAPTPEE